MPLLSTRTKSQKGFTDRSEHIFCWVMKLLLAWLAVRWASRRAFGSDAGSTAGSLRPHLRSLWAGSPPQTTMTEKHTLPDAPARRQAAASGEGAREGGLQPSGRQRCCRWLQRVEITSTPVLPRNCTSPALVLRSILDIKT